MIYEKIKQKCFDITHHPQVRRQYWIRNELRKIEKYAEEMAEEIKKLKG